MLRFPPARAGLRVGLISDIHAQFPFLLEALDLLRAVEVDRVVCLGDVVEKGPDPDAVIDCLRDHCIATVRGNHDANALRHARLEPRESGMRESSLAWLGELPLTREYAWAGRWIGLAHASPIDDGMAVVPSELPKRLKRFFARCDQDVWIVGHTHVPARFRVGSVTVINPGSISSGRAGFPRTCGVLHVPSGELEVYALPSGRRLSLPSEERPAPTPANWDRTRHAD